MNPFPSSFSKSTHTCEHVHSNVWGLFSISINGFKYFVTFIDDISKVTWVYLLKSKDEVFSYFKDFHMMVATKFSTHIKILRFDNGTKYTSHYMTNYLISIGILHRLIMLICPNIMG